MTIQITVTLRDVPDSPELAPGLQHIAEIMPYVLDQYGLSTNQETDLVRSGRAMEATEHFDVTVFVIELALAEGHLEHHPAPS